MDLQSLKFFLQYNSPFITKKYFMQQIGLIFMLHLFFIFILFICKFPEIAIVYIALFILFLVFSIILFAKNKVYKSRFIFNGISFTCLSLLFLSLSYFLLLFESPENVFLLFILSLIYILHIFLVYFIVKRNLRKNRYSKKKHLANIYAFSLSGAVLGGVFARAFAPLLKQDFMILVMSLLFFLIALLSEFGIAEFLKLYYYKKYAKQLDLYETGEKK